MFVIVAGHICLDIIPKWENGGLNSIVPGNLLEMDGVDNSTGGVVANTGLALERLGVKTELFGKIGKDEIGEMILNELNIVIYAG